MNNYAKGLGGGIACRYDSNPKITGSEISNNSSNTEGGGISCYINSSPEILNCKISRNSSELYGSGISASDNSYPKITNCTIIENKSRTLGIIATIGECKSTIFNSIVWNNDATKAIHGNTKVTYSNIEGGYEGEVPYRASRQWIAGVRGGHHDRRQSDDLDPENLPPGRRPA